MEQIKIAIKGIDDKLLIKIPEDNWLDIKQELLEYLNQNKSFLNGAKVILELGSNSYHSSELFELKNILLDHHINIVQLSSEKPETRQAAELIGLRTFSEPKRIIQTEKEVNTSVMGEIGICINKTLRSGNVVNSEGHITVIGDVNPGACIRSKGNIIVWGKLKGEAHAGGNDNRNSVICALEMASASIAIAGISLQDSKRKPARLPELAFIVKNEIKISPWKV